MTLRSIFIGISAIFLTSLPVLAYDGDMDEYHEFKEDLALAKDSYLNALNVYLGDAEFKAGFSWEQIEFEAPSLNYSSLKEVPGGFAISGTHGAYKLDAEVRITPKEDDFRYEVKFQKGTNNPGKEIAGEVFR